jgi:TonB-like protein
MRSNGFVEQPRGNFRWWIASLAILVGVAMGAGTAGLYQALRPSRRIVQPTVTPPPNTPTPAHVALSVQHDGPSLQLIWDRQSAVIRDAVNAILDITDGDRQSQLDLSAQEIQSGLISYWPDSKNVTFRLRVFSEGHSTDDSLHVADAIPAPATATQIDTPKSRPSPFVAPPKPIVPSPLPADFSTSTRRPEPQILIEVDAVGESRWGHAIGHIPLLRRLKKHPQAFVPPAAVHQFRPVLGPRERRDLTRTVPVDLRVFVGDTGKVKNVELMGGANRQSEFATLAADAARRWEFAPARLGDDKVKGEVILHFRFVPEGPPEASQ